MPPRRGTQPRCPDSSSREGSDLMAGRKPYKGRDERSGVSPMHGMPPARSAPPLPDPPAAGERWPPRKETIRPGIGKDWPKGERGRVVFPAGHNLGETHGTSLSSPRNRERIEVRAQEIMAAILEDPLMPGYMRTRISHDALEDYAWAQAIKELVRAWFAGIVDSADDLTVMMLPQLPGTRPPIETMMTADSRSAYHRQRLGLDPLSHAKLRKDLGLDRQAVKDDLARAAAAGAEIVARQQELLPGDDLDDDEGDEGT